MLSLFGVHINIRRRELFTIARVATVYLGLPVQDLARWITCLNKHNLLFPAAGS